MTNEPKNLYEFGPFRLDTAERLLMRNTEVVPLTGKAYETLLVLVKSGGHIVEKDALMKRVWPDTFVEEGSLTQNISLVRRALADGENGQTYIETIPRRGYRFAAPVREVTFPAAERRAPQRGWRTRMLLEAAVLVAAALSIVVYRNRTSAARVPEPDSIAVLPFVNLSASQENEYFSDGLTEELIDALSKEPGLRVVARTSAFQFKGKTQDLRKIGADLNVRTVLDGSVRRSGSLLRVTAQLNNVGDGFHLWSQTYDREVTDMLTVQEDISRAIVRTLKVQTASRDEARMAEHYRRSPVAHDLYLQGMYAYDRSERDGMRRSIGFFQKALEADHRYAPAASALADAYVGMAIFGMSTPQEAIPKAKQAALQALALDPQLADPHAALGFVYATYDWNWPEAQRHFRMAIERNPSCAHCHAWYALYYLAPMQRREEAWAELAQALRWDPLSQPFQALQVIVAATLHEPDVAIERGHQVVELNPDFFLGHAFLGQALRQKRKFEEALKEYLRCVELSGQSPLALRNLGDIYGALGRREEAQRVLHQLEKLRDGGIYIYPSTFAVIFNSLDQTDPCLDWLETGVKQHDPTLVFLESWPLFDRLRSNSRLRSVVTQVGLPL